MNVDQAKVTIFEELRTFLHSMRMEYNTEFRVVFLTAVGKIVCDLEEPAHESGMIGLSDDPEAITIDISAIFDNLGSFNTQLVNAKNVVVYKNNSEDVFMRAEQMAIFADQILGFTLTK